MKNRKFGRNFMRSLSSGAKRISETVTPPMAAEEILGKFIDQELPKFLNDKRIWSFSRYYRMLYISPRECILRLNDREVWHIPSNARTYPSRDELAWAIMKGEASPIISPNGKKVYLYRESLRHHTITIDGGAWIDSYRDWSGIEEERYASMPKVIRHQRSCDYLSKSCKNGWKGVGKLAFPDEKIVCRVTRGLVETTSSPFGDSGWTTTKRNCFDAPWVWVDNRAAVADTEMNTIRFYSADGVLTNEIFFRCSLLSIAKSLLASGVIVAVTKEAVIQIEVYKTSFIRKLLYKSPFVLEDGTVFVANEDGLWKVVEQNETGKLPELVYCPTTVGLPGKIENISVHGDTLVVKCKGIDEEIAFF